MAFANVDIGSAPADGTGDPLRTAFSKINQNFANIAAGQITVTAPVRTVAGRTGNIVLTVNDIIGGASNAYVNSTVTTANTGMKSYVDAQISSSSGYGNTAVEAYLPTSSVIIGIRANMTAANATIASLVSNAAVQSSALDTLTSNAAAQSSSLTTLLANAATQEASLTSLVGNAATQALAITSADANLGTATTNISTLFSNAAAQANQITGANAAIVTANTGMKSYVDSQISSIDSFTANVEFSGQAPTNDNTSGALVITGTGGAAVGGNINIGGQLFVGTNAQTPFLNRAIAVKRGTSLTGPGVQYTQDAIINTSNNGSSDFIAYPDNYPGFNSDHGWMDVGVTGSAFNDPLYEITKSNDGYIFMSAPYPSANFPGGNLVLATDWTGTTNDIMFGVGGFYSNSEVARFHGNTLTNGFFNVKVDTSLFANLSVDGNISAGNIDASGFYGNVLSPYQGNITTVGTLTNLEVTGNTVLRGNLDLIQGTIAVSTLYISGNTAFNNNTTLISSEEINSNVRHIVLKHDATSQAQAAGVGLMTPYSKFTYSDVFDSWSSNVNITPFANATSNIGHIGWRWNNGFFANVYGDLYGEVQYAQQPHITRVGNLTGLTSSIGQATLTSNLEVTGNLTVGNIAYIMGNYQNWNGNVTTISSALDQIAERLKAAGF
jgi:hypothetical protein